LVHFADSSQTFSKVWKLPIGDIGIGQQTADNQRG